jgi:hypothetical protein
LNTYETVGMTRQLKEIAISIIISNYILIDERDSKRLRGDEDSTKTWSSANLTETI